MEHDVILPTSFFFPLSVKMHFGFQRFLGVAHHSVNRPSIILSANVLSASQNYHKECGGVSFLILVLGVLKKWNMHGNLLPLCKYLHKTKTGDLVPPPTCISSHWSENTLPLTSPIYLSIYAVRKDYDCGHNFQRDLRYFFCM